MPLRKQDGTNEGGTSADSGAATGHKFPPEAYAYDTDISEEVVKRVQTEADKIRSNDEWVVIDGVDKR